MDIEEGSMDGESKYAVHSAAEIRELALGIRAGTIFGSWMIPEYDTHLLGCIFMPLMLMDEMQHKALVRDGIVHFYGDIKGSAPRSINGFPIFFSMRSINKEDGERLKSTLESLEAFMSEEN